MCDLVPPDRNFCSMVGELTAKFALGELRVVGHDDGTEPVSSEHRDDVLRAIGHDERDPIAVANAEPLEAVCELLDEHAQVAIRRDRSEKIDGGAPTIALRRSE